MDLGVIRLQIGLVLPSLLNPHLIPSTRIRPRCLTALRIRRLLMHRIMEDVHLITAITMIRHHPIMQVEDILGHSTMVTALIAIMHHTVHRRHLRTVEDQEDTMIKTGLRRTMDNLHLLITHHIHRNLHRIHTGTLPEEIVIVIMIPTHPMQVIMDVLLQDLATTTIDIIITTLIILTTNISTIIKSRRMRSQA